jgi:hypothetical protein
MLPAEAQDQSLLKCFVVLFIVEANQNEAIQHAFSVGWCQISFRQSREALAGKNADQQGENSSLAGRKLSSQGNGPQTVPSARDGVCRHAANRNFAQNTCDAE